MNLVVMLSTKPRHWHTNPVDQYVDDVLPARSVQHSVCGADYHTASKMC